MSETNDSLTGIESNFCTSWEGWDEIDTTVLMFYKVTIKDIFGVDPNVKYDMVVDCQKNKVQLYSDEQDEPVVSRQFTAVLI